MSRFRFGADCEIGCYLDLVKYEGTYSSLDFLVAKLHEERAEVRAEAAGIKRMMEVADLNFFVDSICVKLSNPFPRSTFHEALTWLKHSIRKANGALTRNTLPPFSPPFFIDKTKRDKRLEELAAGGLTQLFSIMQQREDVVIEKAELLIDHVNTFHKDLFHD